MTFKEFILTTKYGSLSYYLKYRIPFYGKWNENHNPLYHWWKVRKHFKRPKAHFIKGTYQNVAFFGFPCRSDYLNMFIDIRFDALGWKSKYDSPRHEWDPYIAITFFRKWMCVWIFNWVNPKDKNSDVRSMATWEAILDILYFEKDLQWCRNNHCWGSAIGEGECMITIDENLKL